VVPADMMTVFGLPESGGKEWMDSARVQQATSIPGTGVFFDRGGKLAQLFGAKTSGFIAAYSPKGGLIYAGGITRGRGLRGESSALRDLKQALSEEHQSGGIRSVFGCGLAGFKS